MGYSLALPTIDVMVEILPVFAIETGLGYKYSIWQNTYTNTSGIPTIDSFTRSEIYIPLMLRGQSKYGIGITYVSVGVKMGFPLSSSYYVTETYSDGKLSTGTIGAEPAKFTLDVSFVVGQEFKIADTHYIGIKATYDLNVLEPFAPRENNTGTGAGLDDKAEWYQNDLTFALTYRYAFEM